MIVGIAVLVISKWLGIFPSFGISVFGELLCVGISAFLMSLCLGYLCGFENCLFGSISVLGYYV